VIRERDVLLGDDDAVAHASVSQARAKIVERYEEAFEQLEITEIQAVGENSYLTIQRARKRLEMGTKSLMRKCEGT
jgi:hypothetical protein